MNRLYETSTRLTVLPKKNQFHRKWQSELSLLFSFATTTNIATRHVANNRSRTMTFLVQEKINGNLEAVKATLSPTGHIATGVESVIGWGQLIN